MKFELNNKRHIEIKTEDNLSFFTNLSDIEIDYHVLQMNVGEKCVSEEGTIVVRIN